MPIGGGPPQKNDKFFKAYGDFLAACPKDVPLGTGARQNNGCPQAVVGSPTVTFPHWGSGGSGIDYRTPTAQRAASTGFFAGAKGNADVSPCAGCTPPASNNGSCPVIT